MPVRRWPRMTNTDTTFCPTCWRTVISATSKCCRFLGFAKMHTLELDLGEPYRGGPLWLLMHGEVEYFSANSMYAADQAGLHPVSPYVEALGANGKWTHLVDDMGFPAGGARTMTADLTGKLPVGTQRIRIATNLQIYWDSILIDRASQDQGFRLTAVPLVKADLRLPWISPENREPATRQRRIYL